MPDDRSARSTMEDASGGSGGGEELFHPGNLLDGKYSIEGTIARGGLGVIVRGHHVGLGRPVAIKYLKPEALENPAIVQRFEREARLAVQIASEHVVRVLDVGRTPHSGPYMVMEYLVGRDLGSILEEGGALPISRAVDYALQACDALAEAHALRIVHRDIKPDNLFLAQRPSNTAILKIIDFGISKAPPKQDDDGSWKRDTSAGDRFGTPLYMSPEQLRNSAGVDQRTDIWSLGVVLYELVAGKAPFDAEDVPELFGKILHEAPAPLRQLCPEVPAALEAAIMRCLEKKPEHRFRNVAELAQELEPFSAPEASRRIGRIKQVVRRGGYSVRPPTPLAFKPVPVPIAPTPSVPAVVQAHPILPAGAGRERVSRRTILLAAGGGLALVIAIVLLASLRAGSSGTQSAETTAQPTASAPEPSAAAVAATAAPAPTPAESSETPPATAPTEPRVASAAAEPATVAPPPKPRPTAAPDKRTLFGDRK